MKLGVVFRKNHTMYLHYKCLTFKIRMLTDMGPGKQLDEKKYWKNKETAVLIDTFQHVIEMTLKYV